MVNEKARRYGTSSMGELVLLALVAASFGGPAAAAAAAKPQGPPAKELAKEAYEVVTDPAALPSDVRIAWALQLQQRHLDVAAAGASYNSSDHGPGTKHRLILAAVGPKYVVAYFESGGIAVYRRVFVFSCGTGRAAFVWGGRPKETFADPKSFLGAIKNGKLWREEKRKQ
jgi:hypothetical protein